MLLDALLSILHHLAVYTLLALLVAELVLLHQEPSAPLVRALARVDLFFGIAAGVVVAVGTCRVLYGVKGAAFYTGNALFWTKIGLFLLVALISIFPTMRFIQWTRRGRASPAWLPSQLEFRKIGRIVGVETALFGLIPVCAALMARGFGY
jgi:putative membrane protein